MAESDSASPDQSGDPAPFVVRRAEPGDLPELIRIFEVCLGKAPSPAEWEWRWDQVPDGAVRLVLTCDRKIVGQRSFAFFPTWIDGTRVDQTFGAYSMVLPEYRGRRGLHVLMQHYLESDHGSDLIINLPNDLAAPILERAGAGRQLGRLPLWVRYQRCVPRLPRPVGRAAATTLRLRGAAGRVPRPDVVVGPLDELGDEIDQLAEASAAFAPCIRIRDAQYLRWRWADQPDKEVRLRAARDHRGELRGFVAFGQEQEAGLPVGRIVDLLAVDANALRALVYAALDELVADGMERITCDYLDPRPWGSRTLRRAGFVPRPGVNVVSRGLTPVAGSTPERLENWYLTRSDTDAS